VLPDGNVVSGSLDETFHLWNTLTGEIVRSFAGHTKAVTSVAVLPDGNLVSGSVDGTLRLWNTFTGETIRTFTGHTDIVNCVAILPDGNLVSGSVDTTLRVWNTRTGETIRTFSGHTKSVYCVAVFPNGNFVSGSFDKTACLWNYSRFLQGRTLKGLQLAMGKQEEGRTFHSPNFGIDANTHASILHRMPRDPRVAIGSFLGLPTNTRTNPERNANRRVGTSNYTFKMEQLRGERTSHSRRKTRKCARTRRNT
jgi:WD40 repeat protein